MSFSKKLIEEIDALGSEMGMDMGAGGVAEASPEAQAFADLLASYGLGDIQVTIEKDGTDSVLQLTDAEGDTEAVVFSVDEEGNPFAIVYSGMEGEETVVVDLSSLEPPIGADGGVDLSDPSWINRSTLLAILGPGDIGDAYLDALGADETIEDIEEAKDTKHKIGDTVKKLGREGRVVGVKFAMKGTKRVKVALIKWKGQLKGKALAAMGKLHRVHASKAGQAKRKYAIASKIGKRMGLYKKAA